MIELTMILTSTTKPLDLTYALEWYMTPLKVIKFPAHEVAMVISIALRFIPTLLDETTRIMKAQESRGVDFKHGKFSARLKAIVSLIIPLFISAFQRSEELADSMEARGYDPSAQRTRYRILKFHWKDLFSFAFRNSDNIAYAQLKGRFGFSSYYKLLGELGIYLTMNDERFLSARDYGKIMKTPRFLSKYTFLLIYRIIY